MLQLKHLRWFLLVPVLSLAAVSVGQVPRSPFYSARPGSAEPTDARKLKGKFYYHQDPLSSAVSFYYYSKGTASQEIIPVARIKTLTLSTRSDTTKHYMFRQRNGKLFLGNADASQQELTRALFGKL